MITGVVVVELSEFWICQSEICLTLGPAGPGRPGFPGSPCRVKRIMMVMTINEQY